MQRRQSDIGNIFWGCSRFPDCRGVRATDDELQDLFDYIYGEDDIPRGDFYDDGSSEAKWYYGDDDPKFDPWDY